MKATATFFGPSGAMEAILKATSGSSRPPQK